MLWSSRLVRCRRRRALAVLFAILALPVGSAGQSIEWLTQIGTDRPDWATSVSLIPDGGLYTTGYTFGPLGGTNAGNTDAFLARYDQNGSQVWLRQFGEGFEDKGFGVATGPDGSAYVTGHNEYRLGTSATTRWYEPFLTKFSPDGAVEWTRVLAQGGGAFSYDVAVGPNGRVAIAGTTSVDLVAPVPGRDAAFVAVYDGAGNLDWVRQIGTDELEQVGEVEFGPDGEVYLVGRTGGALSGPDPFRTDAFVAKYGTTGDLEWVDQFGTLLDYEYAEAIDLDAEGNLYVSGYTEGSLAAPHAGQADVFVRKLTPEGTEVWTTQYGSDSTEAGDSIWVDRHGSSYVGGWTSGVLGGAAINPLTGGRDAFLSKLGPDGRLLWTEQFGTRNTDALSALVGDGRNGLYFAGQSRAGFGGTYLGQEDVFIGRFFVPEPSAGVIAVIGWLAVGGRRSG